MRALSIFCLVLLLSAFASAQLEKDPRYVKKRAERMMAQYDFKACLDYLEMAEKNLPRDGEILILKGETFFLLDRYEEAIATYQRGFALDPRLEGKVPNHAIALVRSGRLDEAKKAAQILIDKADGDRGRANGHFVLGLAAWHEGQLESASRELELAVGLEPRLGKAWYRLGLVHLHAGRGKEAGIAFSKVLELDRLHHGAAYNLGLAELRLGDREKAAAARALHADIIAARKELQTLRANLDLRPKDPAILRRMADIYFDFGAWDEAAPIYAAVTAANPVDLAPRLRFARCKFETRDYHEARIQSAIILQRDPENVEARKIQDAIINLIGEDPENPQPSSQPTDRTGSSPASRPTGERRE